MRSQEAHRQLLVDRVVLGQQDAQRQALAQLGVELGLRRHRLARRRSAVAPERDQRVVQLRRLDRLAQEGRERRRRVGASLSGRPAELSMISGSVRLPALQLGGQLPARPCPASANRAAPRRSGSPALQQRQRLCARGRFDRASCPRRAVCRHQHAAVGALSSTISSALAREAVGVRSVALVAAARASRASTMVKWKVDALARHAAALDPDASAHQLDQALADGQPEAGAAVAPRGRGVDLAEGLEQPVLAVGRDADAGVRTANCSS